jgi:hypothetical protein
MKQSLETRPTRWDALIVLLVVLCAVASAVTIWGGQEKSDRVTMVVSVDGEEVDRYDLAELPNREPLTYSHNGYTLRVGLSLLYPDKPCIRVLESDCPTQDCVHTGEIYRAGQSIVCLPARIIIELEGAPETGGPDVVIG